MGAVKGTITRRMDSALNGLQSEFKSLYTRKDFEKKIEALYKSGINSDRPSKLRQLFLMFDSCGIKYERGKDNHYYEELVKNADLPSLSEIEDRMLATLFSMYEDYPSPGDYMKRIVDRLCNEADGWENDPLRLRILKQFIKYGNYLSDAGYGGRKTIDAYVKEKTGRKATEEDVLAELDDGVFEALAAATKAQKKPDGKFGLLKTADDLASGKFRAEGATKKSLYLFAMVYGMTFYSGDEDITEIIDSKTDIEVNLFRDYYANNLMRFISDEYQGKLCEFERDPSGQGINYKNFAEMIYLYYISKDCTPQDKIRLSSAMIKRVQDSQFRQDKNGTVGDDDTDTDKIRDTEAYRNLFSEDILGKTEEDFEAFICENYDCDTFAGSFATRNGVKDQKNSPIQLETEQNSAFAEYKAILELVKKYGPTLEKCNYGLWFVDPAAFRKKGCENICSRIKNSDRTKVEKFMDLILGINAFMGHTADETSSLQNEVQEWKNPSVMKTKALFVESPEAVTRTSMIVAYYYYYNALHENDKGDRWKSFEEVFTNFEKTINARLEGAYYQPLSGKNIFDVIVTFSSYAYLNL